MKTTKKIQLPESEMPKAWYNIIADMKNQPLPMLNPGTKQPLKPEEMEGLFAKGLVEQEFSKERYIEIPDEDAEKIQSVRDAYSYVEQHKKK